MLKQRTLKTIVSATGVGLVTLLRTSRSLRQNVSDTVARAEAALADVNPRTSWRASKEFRIQLVKELSARALREAARKGGADV